MNSAPLVSNGLEVGLGTNTEAAGFSDIMNLNVFELLALCQGIGDSRKNENIKVIVGEAVKKVWEAQGFHAMLLYPIRDQGISPRFRTFHSELSTHHAALRRVRSNNARVHAHASASPGLAPRSVPRTQREAARLLARNGDAPQLRPARETQSVRRARCRRTGRRG